MNMYRYAVICVTGLSFFLICYKITVIFLFKLLKQFKLTHGDIYVISERVVSAVQAVLACVVGLITIKECRSDLLKDRHWIIEYYAWFAVPYFYYDVYAMYNTFWFTKPAVQTLSNIDAMKEFFRKEPLMMFHHVILPPVCFPIIMWYRNGLGDFFLGCLFMFELVIPLISLRSILKQLNMEDTLLYSINGISLIVVWIFCRILIFPYMYWEYAQSKNKSIFEVPSQIPFKCNIGCSGLLILQLYWLVYMLKTAVKTVQKRKQKHNKKEATNSLRNGVHSTNNGHSNNIYIHNYIQQR